MAVSIRGMNPLSHGHGCDGRGHAAWVLTMAVTWAMVASSPTSSGCHGHHHAHSQYLLPHYGRATGRGGSLGAPRGRHRPCHSRDRPCTPLTAVIDPLGACFAPFAFF